MGDEFLTVKDLSDYLKIPRDTIYRLVKSGGIPGTKIGKQWRFSKREINHWFKRKRTAGEKRTK